MRAALLLISLLAAACGIELEEGAKLKPLESTPVVANQRSARPLPEGSVPRAAAYREDSFENGLGQGDYLTDFPVPLSRGFIDRGEERFSIYCTPCHGSDGEGNGAVVSRGFPVPESLKSARLRNMPAGYFVNVVAEGFETMPSYENIRPEDRWAIAAFIVTLQDRDPYSLADTGEHEVERSDNGGQLSAPEHGQSVEGRQE